MSSTLEPQGQESRWMPYSQTRSNWELGQCTPTMSPAMKSATGKGEPSKGSKQGGQADEFRQGGSHVILRAWKEDAWSREALRQGRGGLLLSEMRKTGLEEYSEVIAFCNKSIMSQSCSPRCSLSAGPQAFRPAHPHLPSPPGTPQDTLVPTF